MQPQRAGWGSDRVAPSCSLGGGWFSALNGESEVNITQVNRPGIIIFAAIAGLLSASVALAENRDLLQQMQVADSCGVIFSEKLAACTPFRCQRPNPILSINLPTKAELNNMTPAQQQQTDARIAAIEKQLEQMTPAKRAEMKERMVNIFEIKGLNAQGLCQTTTSMTASQRQDCSLDEAMRRQVGDFDRQVATAARDGTKSSSHLVDGKMVSETMTTIDGKSVVNAWQQALNSGQCKILSKTSDNGWVAMDQLNEMGRLSLTITRNGKNVRGHLRVSNSEDGQVVFDKSVDTTRKARDINLKPGSYDIEITDEDGKLEPVRIRGSRISAAQHWQRSVELAPGEVRQQAASMTEEARNLIPLQLYWSGKKLDNFVTATPEGAQEAMAAGYRYVRVEACITGAGPELSEKTPQKQPLKRFWSQDRGDHFAAASMRGEHDASAASYELKGTEGYISRHQKPGTIPLKLYWNSVRKDNFSTATRQGVHDAEAAGYRFARIQGYVYPAARCQSKNQ